MTKSQVFSYNRVNNNYLYLIVVDPMSGRKGRYTTYRVSLKGTKTVKLIGRELPLATSKELIQRFIDNKDRFPDFIRNPLKSRSKPRR